MIWLFFTHLIKGAQNYKKMRSFRFLILISSGIIITSIIYSCSSEVKSAEELTAQNSELTDQDLVIKGKYLVNIMGCHDCHSPKKIGPNGPAIIPELMLSGYPQDRPIPSFDLDAFEKGFSMMNQDLTAAAGPWGISFAGNLTPHATGLGNWTEVQFKKAITQGKYKGVDGNRMLLPPMPWINYKKLKDDDIKAIFTYLQSIKPVENIVPQPIQPVLVNF